MEELAAKVEYIDTTVIDILTREGLSMEKALEIWMLSKTREEFTDEKNNLLYVSPARMCFELHKELDGDEDWMCCPFE